MHTYLENDKLIITHKYIIDLKNFDNTKQVQKHLKGINVIKEKKGLALMLASQYFSKKSNYD